MSKNRDLNSATPKLRGAFLLAKMAYEKKWINRFLEVRIDYVLRSDEEQKALYWSSRYEEGGVIKTIPGKRHVTNLDGVQYRSKHQANAEGKSEAIDFFFVARKTSRGLVKGSAIWSGPFARIAYSVFGRLCEKQGLVWGGRWFMQDLGHIETP